MPEREAGNDDVSGLPKLPPGRHGLGRDFVVSNQRDRLTAGVISVVAAEGFHDATITTICSAAGVSRRTFYGHFSSKQECYAHAFKAICDHLEKSMQAAADDLPWPRLVSARLRAMLETFAANPDLFRFSFLAPLRAGDALASYHRPMLSGIRAILVIDLPEGAAPRPSDAVQEALVGGMMALIAKRVESGMGERVLDLLPDLVELFLAPFIGRDKAVEAARKGA